jgi:hypothetical protein
MPAIAVATGLVSRSEADESAQPDTEEEQS